jgi:hypothetical protein
MSTATAWLLVALFSNNPTNSNTIGIFVPGIASQEACDALATKLFVPNHKCINYEMALPHMVMAAPGTPDTPPPKKK